MVLSNWTCFKDTIFVHVCKHEILQIGSTEKMVSVLEEGNTACYAEAVESAEKMATEEKHKDNLICASSHCSCC